MTTNASYLNKEVSLLEACHISSSSLSDSTDVLESRYLGIGVELFVGLGGCGKGMKVMLRCMRTTKCNTT
jgi:hypothetical protein